MDHIPFNEILQKQRSVVSELLVVLITTVLLVWYLRFLWRRRNLYKSASQLPGPFALPLIGSAFYFIGGLPTIYKRGIDMLNQYPGLWKNWFGTRLFYVVSDPKYFEILLSSPHALMKDRFYLMAEAVFGQGLLIAPVAKWKKHRKLLMPTFNQKILDQFMEVFVEQSEVLVSELKQHAGKGEVDILDLINKCTLDIICETAMGVQIKAQSTDSNFPKWVDRSMEIFFKRIFTIPYHVDLIFDNLPIGKEFHDLANNIRSFTRDVLKEKRIQYENKLEVNKETYTEEETTKRIAFLDLLMKINYEQGKSGQFSDEQILDETITFIIGGSDTTASTLCFIFTMLGMFPDVQDKVLTEILSVVGPSRPVEASDLPKLKYLEQVIKETLRLFPVGLVTARYLDEDIDVGDHILQKGNTIIFGIIRLHTNEQYWPNPFKFDPDRFLPEEVAKRAPGCYVPFSFGPRNCIGIKYAMMSMKALLTTVLRKYRIYTTYKNVQEIELEPHLVVRPTHGYKVSLELRN